LFAQGCETRKLNQEEKRLVHKLIKRVSEDIEKLDNNTAIAALMEGLNDFSKLSRESAKKKLPKEMLEAFCLLLTPFAPFMAEEIWVNQLGNKPSVHQQSWPKFAKEMIKEKEITLIVQVNGKLRGSLKMESGEGNEKKKVVTAAQSTPGVDKYLTGKKIKKIIFIPGRLINFAT